MKKQLRSPDGIGMSKRSEKHESIGKEWCSLPRQSALFGTDQELHRKMHPVFVIEEKKSRLSTKLGMKQKQKQEIWNKANCETMTNPQWVKAQMFPKK